MNKVFTVILKNTKVQLNEIIVIDFNCQKKRNLSVIIYKDFNYNFQCHTQVSEYPFQRVNEAKLFL